MNGLAFSPRMGCSCDTMNEQWMAFLRKRSVGERRHVYPAPGTSLSSFAYLLRSDLQHNTHLTGSPIAVVLLSEIALNKLLEVNVSSFFGDLNHAATNAHGAFPMGGVNDAEHHPWIAL